MGGHDNGCDWELNDINFSDFWFRKESVHITLGTPGNANEELLRISAWDISAHFRGMKVAVKQTQFPFAQANGVADAKAERMSVTIAFKFEVSTDSSQPRLVMSSRSVHMENLELWVGETNYAVIINALSFLFADTLKGYACRKICSRLDDHMEVLINTINSTLETCTPLLAKIGWELPAATPAVTEADDAADQVHEAATGAAITLRAVGRIPEEIDWADPGRTFAVRV